MIKKILTMTTTVFLCSTVLADRQLDRSEILGIFTALTQTPKKTWIPAGTIKAVHEEYRAPQITDANEINTKIGEAIESYQNDANKIQLTKALQQMRLEAIPFNVRYELANEYTMNSTTEVRYNGDKFYWEINIGMRVDSEQKPSELVGNFLTEEFDLKSNEKRVFAWNGSKYITYFRPVNHAMITDEPGGINGPLTAGVIPWGYGKYTLAALSDAESSATEIDVDGQVVIQLTVNRDNREETFILDPAKNYALESFLAYIGNSLFILHDYTDYQLVTGNWCPSTVVIEQYDTTDTPNRLLASDNWRFTSINTQILTEDNFKVKFEADAYIEDFTFGSEPFQYRYSPPQFVLSDSVNTDELLNKRQIAAIAEKQYPQNCATASLKYICDKLNIPQSFEAVSKLAQGRKKRTTLLQMQEFADNLGLNALAVKIDIETLKKLSGCQVIVFLPKAGHFAVLGQTDAEYVRLIDLSSNSFYSRFSNNDFNRIWDGTAFLVAKQPITPKGNFTKIAENRLDRIAGAWGGSLCNTWCSSSGNFPCQEVGGDCIGPHVLLFARKCCGTAVSGTCSEGPVVYKLEQTCAWNENLDCTGMGDWKSYTMSACG